MDGHGMMQWIKMLAMAFTAIFAGAVISAIPPLPGWFGMVDANQTFMARRNRRRDALRSGHDQLGTLARES